jgi:hypothetical protein
MPLYCCEVDNIIQWHSDTQVMSECHNDSEAIKFFINKWGNKLQRIYLNTKGKYPFKLVYNHVNSFITPLK